MDLAARLGQAALILALLAIAIGPTVVAPRALRVRRRGLEAASTARAGRAEVVAMLWRLRASQAETRELLRPWRRVYRWARHPLVWELFRWYRRRRRGMRRGP